MADEPNPPTAPEPGVEITVELKKKWVGADAVPIVVADEFSLGGGATTNDIVFTIGQVSPPLFVGSPAEQIAQAKETSHVSIRTLSRVSLTPAAVTELARLFTDSAETHAGR